MCMSAVSYTHWEYEATDQWGRGSGYRTLQFVLILNVQMCSAAPSELHVGVIGP